MSENKISMGYSSPDRELSARDIKRKEDKLKKTKDKLTKNLSARRRHNLKFKAEKTLDQITTGLSGIRPIKTPFKLKHQKSSPFNAKCPKGWTLNPDKKGKPCLPPREQKPEPKSER